MANKTNKVEYQLSLKDMLSSPLAKADSNVQHFEHDVDNAFNSVNRLNSAMSNGMAGSFMQTTGAVALGSLLTSGVEMAGRAAVEQVKSILSAGLDVGKLKAEFEVLGGGKEVGNALFGDINKYIQESIFGTELFTDAKTLLAYGTSVNDILPDLKMLGDISMGDAEKMKSLTLAFGQTMAAGKLAGQDLLQYIATGFNPLKEIERTTGVSYAKLKDMMSDGTISAKMVKDAFISATSAGGLFNGMLDKIGETPFGKLQAMQGNIEAAKQQLGEALLPAMSDFMDASRPLIEALPSMFKQLQPLLAGAIHDFADLATWISKNGDTVQRTAKLVKSAIEAYAIWRVGTTAITTANWLWAASIRGVTSAQALLSTSSIAETEAIATQTAVVNSETVALTELAAAKNLVSAATVASGEAAAVSGIASIGAAGAGALAVAGQAVLPVAVMFFGGMAVNTLGDYLTKKDRESFDDKWRMVEDHTEKKGFRWEEIKQVAGAAATSVINIPVTEIKEAAELEKKWMGKPASTKPTQPKTPSELTAPASSRVTGQQVKNTYVTINGGLIHDFTIKTTNMQQATPQIKRVVTEAITDAINDSQISD